MLRQNTMLSVYGAFKQWMYTIFIVLIIKFWLIITVQKYVANRQCTIFKGLIITLKLPKAVGSEQSLATLMSSKSIIKLCFFKWHQQLNFLTLVHWLHELNAAPRSFTHSKLTKLTGFSSQVVPDNDFSNTVTQRSPVTTVNLCLTQGDWISHSNNFPFIALFFVPPDVFIKPIKKKENKNKTNFNTTPWLSSMWYTQHASKPQRNLIYQW